MIIGLIMIKTKNGGLKMSCQDKDLQLKVVVDDAFENSYWAFNVQEAIKQASQKFREQFGVGFSISEVAGWNSVGTLNLVDYPDNVIKRIPRGVLSFMILIPQTRRLF
ncbi:MAG: hypothetical protein COU83_01610 [Candidatus Portnoybacteria bacterium CG10_big_fil_rev_8_21_14_0_10_40_22]|uniref:Uncharacterized protein n=1 Tax=Candidatus Portnoybacteria bacterium CG10_big_fil_rev_8_21_14_0_10_40_22 TaxID=1974814 RepID=A0A2M8KG23_9BACT|nr:MAG: hypothetical protein COU83_01610 [Candidatus Portnoybacteria bacterium CG10_big_fil_rev_8_21_14_0_10_40_22]